jgi:hypothetical protein
MKKYFFYNPENDSALDSHTMHETWGGAAAEAMSDDGYAWSCREITADDLPSRFNVINSQGRVVEYFRDKDDADTEAASLGEDGEPHTIERVADESDYTIGDFGLWVHPRHFGNNCYAPEGAAHRDFTNITGPDVESCLHEYSERGDSGYCHPRHHVIVAEATFDANGNLIEADGISAAESDNHE